MSGIDLHTHSTASDGTESPAAVVTSARRAGLEVIALTDHDTAHGWDEAAAAAARHGVGLVRGMEISCSRYGRSIHLLGYLVDPDHPGLATEIGYAREARVSRLRRMVEKMAADGIPLTYERGRRAGAAGRHRGPAPHRRRARRQRRRREPRRGVRPLARQRQPLLRAPLRARPGATRFGWSSRPAASRCMPTRSGAAAVRARGTR